MQFEIVNESTGAFNGFYRTVLDRNAAPTHRLGKLNQAGGRRFAIGRDISDDNCILDIELKLAPGERYVVDTKNLVAEPFDVGVIPGDPNYFGWPRVNGIPMEFIGWHNDGAYIIVKYGIRHIPLLATFLELKYCPGETFATGWISCTASNPTIPDMQAPLELELEMKGQKIRPWNDDYIGDGQTRLMLVGFVFEDRDDATTTVKALTEKRIAGHGVAKVGFSPKPDQARFNPVVWKNKHKGAMANVRGYSLMLIGVAPNSTVTGDQETQGFAQGYESLYPGGTGADWPRFWAAMGQARQPCHYLMQNGAMVMPEDFPDAMMWQGRPLWINKKNENPSWHILGKPRAITMQDTHGWFGPDREHRLIHDLAAAYELSGETCLLEELRHHARNFLWEDTVEAGLSTSGPDASRSAGWQGLAVTHLLRLIPRDDPLWWKVANRWKERVELVYLPAWENKKFTNMFPSKPQEIAGWPHATFLYQQAIQVYGQYICCLHLGKWLTDSTPEFVAIMQRCLDMAVRQAETVVSLAYQINDDGTPTQAPTFKEFELLGMRANGEHADWHVSRYRPSVDAHSTGWFRGAWLPLSLWVVVKGSKDQGMVNLATSIRHRLVYEATIANNPNGDNYYLDWHPPL